MNKKFYISNDFKFIQGLGNLVNVSSATHMKRSDAQQYISIHPDHKIIKLNKKKNNASYVVSTNQVFLGEDNKPVSSIGQAKAFNSPTDAYDYLDKKMFIITNIIGKPMVVDEEYRKIKRESTIPQINKLTKDNTGRISFRQNTKDIVAKNSSNICAICGKPIFSYQEDFSVDHITPLSRGGTNDISNLRATHKFCNTLKDNMTDEEMYSTVSDIVCYNLFNKPDSDMGVRIIRSMVRGMIKGSNIS